MGWRVFQRETIFGPRADGKPSTATVPNGNSASGASYTGEAVVAYAADFYNPFGWIIGEIEAVGEIYDATSDFFLRTPLDVINEMAATFSNIGTPILYEISTVNGNPTFYWRERPGKYGYSYSVNFGNGAVVATFEDNADEIFNEVVGGWGKNQSGAIGSYSYDFATGNITIDYSEIRYIRDKAINMSGEVDNIALALQVANGIYSKTHNFTPGWSMKIDIPMSAQVLSILEGSNIPPWRIRAGSNMLLNNLNPNQVFGQADHNPPPDTQYITETSWNGKSQTCTVSLGNINSMTDSYRIVTAKSSHMKDASNTAALSLGKKDAAKTKEVGPAIPTSNPPSNPLNGASRMGFGSIAYDKKDETLNPSVMPYQPMAPQAHFKSNDPDPDHPGMNKALGRGTPPVNVFVITVAGSTNNTYHANQNFFQFVEIPIGQIVRYNIRANVASNITGHLYYGIVSASDFTVSGADAVPIYNGTAQPKGFPLVMTMTNDVSKTAAIPSSDRLSVVPEVSVETGTSAPSTGTTTKPAASAHCTVVLIDNEGPGTDQNAAASDISFSFETQRLYNDSVSQTLNAPSIPGKQLTNTSTP